MGSMSLAEMIADFILSAEDEELARARAVLVKDAADVALGKALQMKRKDGPAPSGGAR